MNRALVLLPCLLLLSGCSHGLLERSYSSVTPHSAVYRVAEEADTLQAENYQELVNTLLMLLSEHSADGVVRIYGEHADAAAMAERACVEVQQETAIGSYLLDYITYDGTSESGYYELTVRFRYRRTAEEQAAVINATSTEALPDLLRDAIAEGRGALAVRIGYFGTDRPGVLSLVKTVREELRSPEESAAADPEAPAAETAAETEAAPPEGEADAEPDQLPDVSPWQVLFYPDSERPGIIEVILTESD